MVGQNECKECDLLYADWSGDGSSILEFGDDQKCCMCNEEGKRGVK